MATAYEQHAAVLPWQLFWLENKNNFYLIFFYLFIILYTKIVYIQKYMWLHICILSIIMPYNQAINCVNTIMAHKTTMEAIKKYFFYIKNIICDKA